MRESRCAYAFRHREGAAPWRISRAACTTITATRLRFRRRTASGRSLPPSRGNPPADGLQVITAVHCRRKFALLRVAGDRVEIDHAVKVGLRIHVFTASRSSCVRAEDRMANPTPAGEISPVSRHARALFIDGHTRGRDHAGGGFARACVAPSADRIVDALENHQPTANAGGFQRNRGQKRSGPTDRRRAALHG